MSGLSEGREHLYASALYAKALAHVGREVRLAPWGAFVLARPLPSTDGEDAIGGYPLAVIDATADLEAGLRELTELGLVSVVLVPDPLRGPGPGRLQRAFELCRPFKTHYLIEPRRDFEPSKHHRDRIRRGLRRSRVERVGLSEHRLTWATLYAGLVDRRAIRGAADFPPAYFDRLAEAPGLQAFLARVDDRPAGMTLWFEHDGVVYNHLAASNAEGYANGANYALYAAAIDHFAGAGVINLGGGAGFEDDPGDGLAAFKRGFANGEVSSLLCGAVLDPGRYAQLSETCGASQFFPAYRG